MNNVQEKEALLALRGKLAFEAKDGHSWSFGDRELNALLEVKPKNYLQLCEIKGFPAKGKRVEAYGQNIIDIFNGVCVESFDVRLNGDTIEVKNVMIKSSSFSK